MILIYESHTNCFRSQAYRYVSSKVMIRIFISPPNDLNVAEGWCESKLDKAGDPSELVDLLPGAQPAGVVRAGGPGHPLRLEASVVHTDRHRIATRRAPSSV